MPDSGCAGDARFTSSPTPFFIYRIGELLSLPLHGLTVSSQLTYSDK